MLSWKSKSAQSHGPPKKWWEQRTISGLQDVLEVCQLASNKTYKKNTSLKQQNRTYKISLNTPKAKSSVEVVTKIANLVPSGWLWGGGYNYLIFQSSIFRCDLSVSGRVYFFWATILVPIWHLLGYFFSSEIPWDPMVIDFKKRSFNDPSMFLDLHKMPGRSSKKYSCKWWWKKWWWILLCTADRLQQIQVFLLRMIFEKGWFPLKVFPQGSPKVGPPSQ